MQPRPRHNPRVTRNGLPATLKFEGFGPGPITRLRVKGSCGLPARVAGNPFGLSNRTNIGEPRHAYFMQF